RRDTPRDPPAVGRGEGRGPPGRARASHARRGLPAAHGTTDAGRGSQADVPGIPEPEAMKMATEVGHAKRVVTRTKEEEWSGGVLTEIGLVTWRQLIKLTRN